MLEKTKEIERYKKEFEDFGIYTITCDINFEVFSYNDSLRRNEQLLNIISEIQQIIKNIGIAEIVKTIEQKYSYNQENAIVAGGVIYNLVMRPIKHDNEIVGLIIFIVARSDSNFALSDIQSINALGNMTNNIRASLNKIFLSIESISSKATSEETDTKDEPLKEIDLYSHKILRQVNNLNVYLELISNKHVLNKTLVDISEWAEKTSTTIKANLKDSPIKFNIKYPEEHIMACVDLELMDMAFANLIHNAIYYSIGPNEINVVVSNGEDSFKIEISDTGKGFAEEALEPKEGVASLYQGAGFGLRLVQEVVKIHNGKLNLFSYQKAGTSISMEFDKNLFAGSVKLSQNTDKNTSKSKYAAVPLGVKSALDMPFYEGE